MADSGFKRVVRGKLNLKGGKTLKKASSGKGTKRPREAAAASSSAEGAVSTGSSAAQSQAASASADGEVVAVLHYEDDADRETKRLAAEKQAFHTYSSEGGQVMRYRVKSKSAYGSYKIVEQKLDRPLTRTELLEKRSKHKSDRMCM